MTHEIELRKDDCTETFDAEEDEAILDAAEDAGVEIDHSCRAGSCTSCVARVEEGDVEQKQAMGLDPQQKEDGYALLCVAYPRSDISIVAGVQDELFDLDI